MHARLLARTAILCGCLLAANAAHGAVSVEASVDSPTIGTEDVLRLTLTARDKTYPEVQEPGLESLEGFQLLGPPNVGKQFEFINNRTSAGVSFTWALSPPGEGSFVLGPFKMNVGGVTYETNRVKVQVVEGSLRNQRNNRFDPFSRRLGRSGRRDRHVTRVKTVLSKEEAFIGEPLVLTYYLHSTLRLLEGQLMKAPEFPGFLVQASEPRAGRTRVGEENGLPLYEHVLARYVLIPLERGVHGIPVLRFQLSFHVPEDGFGLGFFDRREQMVKSGQSRVVTVSDLPAVGMQAGYTGAVGRFSMDASISGNQGQVGEAMTLRLTLMGNGNFPQLGPPPLSGLKAFKIYEPQTTGEVSVTPNGLNGDRTWEFVLIPETGGDIRIPPIEFQYFEPEAEEYRIARTRPLDLRVSGEALPLARGGAGTSARGSDGTEDASAVAFVLKPLDAASLRPSPRPWRAPWFWAVATVPALLLAWAVSARLRTRGKEDRAERRRIRRARSVALARLRAARGHMRQESEFFGAVQGALLGFLSDKSGRAAGSWTREEVERWMRGLGVNEFLRKEWAEVLHECDSGRFSPTAVPPAQKKGLLDRAIKLVQRLDRSRDWSGARAAAALAVVVLLAGALPAQEIEELSAQAAAASQRSDYEEAARIFRVLLEEAPESPEIHYNLGVTLFRAGDPGGAILHLERAHRHAPGDVQVDLTLRSAREELGLAPDEPDPLHAVLGVVYGRVSVAAVAVFAVSAWAVALLCGTAWVLRRSSFWRAVSLGALAACVMFLLLIAGYRWVLQSPGATVVMSPAQLRSGPSTEYPSLDVPRPGAVGRRLRERAGWVQVHMRSGLTGWVPQDALADI